MTDSSETGPKGIPTKDEPLTSRSFSFAESLDGDKLPVFVTMISPNCGCRVVGDGTLQHPVRVRACDEHREGMPAAWRSLAGQDK